MARQYAPEPKVPPNGFAGDSGVPPANIPPSTPPVVPGRGPALWGGGTGMGSRMWGALAPRKRRRKAAKRKASVKRKRRRSGGKAKLVKGSAAAKRFMAKLRAKRKR